MAMSEASFLKKTDVSGDMPPCTCREDQWCKCAVFYLANPLAIFSLLQGLMMFVEAFQVSVTVGRGVGVEYPDVEKCLLPMGPETCCSDVSSCFVA